MPAVTAAMMPSYTDSARNPNIACETRKLQLMSFFNLKTFQVSSCGNGGLPGEDSKTDKQLAHRFYRFGMKCGSCKSGSMNLTGLQPATARDNQPHHQQHLLEETELLMDCLEC